MVNKCVVTNCYTGHLNRPKKSSSPPTPPDDPYEYDGYILLTERIGNRQSIL